jgi:hypothetical protein
MGVARITLSLLLGLAAVGGSLAAAQAQTGEDEVARRMPHYCEYQVDVKSLPNPHRSLAQAALDEDAIVCPFGGEATRAVIYQPRRGDGCAAGDLQGLPVLAARVLDGPSARRAEQCVDYDDPPRSSAVPAGQAYNISFTFGHGGLGGHGRDPGMEGSSKARRSGGVTYASFGFGGSLTDLNAPSDGSICLRMRPDLGMDAVSYLKLIGVELPADAKQQAVAGCQDPDTPRQDWQGWHTTFSLWLRPTAETPDRAAVQRDLEAAFRAADASTNHRRFVRTGYRSVARTHGGTALVAIGGKRQVMLELRALDPGVCELAYALATRSHLVIHMGQGDYATLTPPGVVADNDKQAWRVAPVTSAADLCLMLAPSFAEWRAHTVGLPLDLRDLDNRQMALGD